MLREKEINDVGQIELNTPKDRKDVHETISKDLDCEELSESGDDGSGNVVGLQKSDLNRMDCCYKTVKRRKTGEQIIWQSNLTKGIIFADKKEYVFREAMVTLNWGDSKKSNKKRLRR